MLYVCIYLYIYLWQWLSIGPNVNLYEISKTVWWPCIANKLTYIMVYLCLAYIFDFCFSSTKKELSLFCWHVLALVRHAKVHTLIINNNQTKNNTAKYVKLKYKSINASNNPRRAGIINGVLEVLRLSDYYYYFWLLVLLIFYIIFSSFSCTKAPCNRSNSRYHASV